MILYNIKKYVNFQRVKEINAPEMLKFLPCHKIFAHDMIIMEVA